MIKYVQFPKNKKYINGLFGSATSIVVSSSLLPLATIQKLKNVGFFL